MAIDGVNLYGQMQTNFEKFGIPELKRQGLKGKELEDQIARYYQGINYDVTKANSKAFGKAYGKEVAKERAGYIKTWESFTDADFKAAAAKTSPASTAITLKPAVVEEYPIFSHNVKALQKEQKRLYKQGLSVTQKATYMTPAVTGQAVLPQGITSKQFFDLVEEKYGNAYKGINPTPQLTEGAGGAVAVTGNGVIATPAPKGKTIISGNVIDYVDRGDGVFVREGEQKLLDYVPKNQRKLTPEEISNKKADILQRHPEYASPNRKVGKAKADYIKTWENFTDAEFKAASKASKTKPLGKLGKFFKGKGGKAALIGAAVLALGTGIGLLVKNKKDKKAAEEIKNNPIINPNENNTEPSAEVTPVVPPEEETAPVVPVTPEDESEFAPNGIYTVKKGDCVWNIAKAKLAQELGRTPTNAEILRETHRIMEKNKEANAEKGTRKLEWAEDHYHVMIKKGDKIDVSA